MTRFGRDLLLMLTLAGPLAVGLSYCSRAHAQQQMTPDQARAQRISAAASHAVLVDLGALMQDEEQQKARADDWQQEANAQVQRADAEKSRADAAEASLKTMTAERDKLKAIILRSDAELGQ